MLALFKRDLMAAAVGTEDLPAQVTSQDRVAIVLQVKSLEEAVSRLRAKGAAFVTEQKDYSAWTIRAAHLRDPEGNLIELFEPLPPEKLA